MKEKALSVILWISEENPAERKVLILKVTPERGGFWQSPTGHLDKGESFLDAALREAEEETGLQGFRFPQYLGLDYRFEGRWGFVRERAYLLIYPYGAAPPAIKIDPKEHVDLLWVTTEEALHKIKFENNRIALERASSDPLPLYLSSRGEFYHEGIAVTHEKTLSLFHRSINSDPEGFSVIVDKERLRLFPETYAFFIKTIDVDQETCILLSDEVISFAPENLLFSANGFMLLKLPNGGIAKFLSAAYYEIANFISQESPSNQPVLHWKGSSFKIPVLPKEV